MRFHYIKLLARVHNDGYLLACTDDLENGWNDSYWYDMGFKDEEVETILIEVPDYMRDVLLKHGTSEQVYHDGYYAWGEAMKKGEVIAKNI